MLISSKESARIITTAVLGQFPTGDNFGAAVIEIEKILEPDLSTQVVQHTGPAHNGRL